MDEHEWVGRRGWLNHDFLGKTYPMTLGTWDTIRSGEVTNPTFVPRFREWARRRDEIRALLADTAEAMSPKVLLMRPPLDRLSAADRDWLANVVDRNWRERYRIVESVRRAQALVDEADRHYEVINAAIDAGPEPLVVDRLKQVNDALRQFAQTCAELNASITALPHRVVAL